MGGIIGSGEGYRRTALSGMARLSEQEQQREAANKQLDQAQTQQEMSMGASAAGLILTLAMMSSDERLKNILGRFLKGSDELSDITPIVFEYKEQPGVPHVGFSAQNVLPDMQEAVTQGEDGFYSVNLFPIVAALVNAVKELKAEIAELKEK